jgi:filamentous hemagglutinin family protein
MKAVTVILPVIFLGVLAPASIVSAQVYQPSNRVPIADNTLGTQVSGSNNNFAITGGVNRGQNLFHSFQDFSVPTGGAATFINPVGNQSIITRVTGNLGSDINGIVNTNGANFFLINPNGVVFGSNAQLNVGRVFAASTANGINLVDGAGRAIIFGTNPSGDAPLLAVNPNVLFNVAQFNLGGGAGEIRNFGTLQPSNLNQYIGLIGGNININGGQLNAPGGKVELGGLAVPGQVGFSAVGDIPRLSFPAGIARSNVALTNKSTVSTIGAGKGDVVVNARNINLAGDSVIRAGIEQGQGTPTIVAGTVRLNATGGIEIDTNSAVVNNVRANAQGQGGDIVIDADTLAIRDEGSAIQAGTYGRGNTGDIRVKIAGNTDFSGTNAGINTLVAGTGVGNGGNVSIETGALSLKNGAKLAAITTGQGNAGNINVNARNAVSLVGADIASTMEEGVGTGGNIGIKADSISLRQGATIAASTFAIGDAGNIALTAKNTISLADPNTTIFSAGERGSIGNGGKISIDAKSVSLVNGAQLNAANSGMGNAGSIAIAAKELVSLAGANTIIFSTIEAGGVGKGGKISIDASGVALSDGAQLRSLSRGKGDAGDVSITASQAVTLTGERTAIFNTIEPGGAGTGGNITVDAGSVLLSNGSFLAASNNGTGNAGNVNVKATGSVDIIGTKSPNLVGGISSLVSNKTFGNSGNIAVDARTFGLQDSAAILAGNLGQGNSGAIKISAADSVLLSGTGGLFVTTASPRGTGGDITISSPQIAIDRSKVNADSVSGNGGNVRIGNNTSSPTTDLLLLRRGAQIVTNASGTPQQGGNGGNININAQFIVAIPTENSDITANAVKGNGGNVNINAQGVFGTQLRPRQTSTSDITASSDLGRSGNIVINTPGIDPGKDLGELPTVPTDATKQIAQTCNTDRVDNKLYITGNGGHPPTTDDLLTNDVIWLDARMVAAPAVARTQPLAEPLQGKIQKLPQPAVGWVLDGKGKVTLIASKEGDVKTTNVVCPNR